MKKSSEHQEGQCAICGKTYPMRELVQGNNIRDQVERLILKDHPEWKSDNFICETDLSSYRLKYKLV